MKTVTLIKGYHGGDGYLHPGQTLQVDADYEKRLIESGHIEGKAAKKEDKEPIQTKEDKTVQDTK